MKAEEVLDLIEEGRFLDSVVDIVWRDMQKTKKTARQKDAKLFVAWVLYTRNRRELGRTEKSLSEYEDLYYMLKTM